MSRTILISGASSGFGALTARALADAGHTVYAGMRDAAGRNAPAASDAAQYSKDNTVDLRTVELDVSSDESARQAVQAVLADQGKLDVLVHNAGHMVTGPAEAFTPEQLANLYDTNVIGAQRLNRAALPHLREQQDGLLMELVSQKLRELEPEWADVAEVAKAIVTVVDTEKGRRPFRVHIDPSDDGAAVVNAVADRVRTEFLRRVELDDLLHPTTA
ncbi:SDR family NAD(P)-dependent oxidoreductase [Kribbella sp. DT2]|uniref:SDR family NAD(P)-dependent oxidoreductase n=1 Tax=Kribbella sp. DT2 TaxID=3393427 RepID=UPI003CF7364F